MQLQPEKDLQDNLSARNQQINNFRQANLRKMDEMRQKDDWCSGKSTFCCRVRQEKHYSVILGTGPAETSFCNQAYYITD